MSHNKDLQFAIFLSMRFDSKSNEKNKQKLHNPNRKLPGDERCMEFDFEYILELQSEKELGIQTCCRIS